jgi:hypothetical protein
MRIERDRYYQHLRDRAQFADYSNEWLLVIDDYNQL